MNKFYKSIGLTAFILVLVSLAGCKKSVDVLGISDDIANKTMLGYYTYTALDTIKMQVAKREYFLDRDNAGNQSGYYRESVAGDGVSSDVTTKLTWEAVMADDQLSMLVTAKMSDGKTKNIIWADGVIKEDGKDFAKSVANLSNIEVQNIVYSQLDNSVFECADTTFHAHKVAVPYMGWKTKTKKSVAAADTAATKQAFIDDLEKNYHDTIVWYMKNKTTSGYIGTYAHYKDTVIAGKDTTLLIDLAVINTTPNAQGKFSILYLVSTEEFDEVQQNDRPESVIYSSIILNNVNNVKTGSYKWQKSTYSLEHYTKAGTDKDSLIDSLYTFDAKSWMVYEFTNQAKFTVMMFGDGDSIFIQAKAGDTIRVEKPEKDAFFLMPLSGYKVPSDPSKPTEVTYGGLKYLKKK